MTQPSHFQPSDASMPAATVHAQPIGRPTVHEGPLHSDLGRSTFAIFFITGLSIICLWILKPFLPAIVWAATLVIATWPIMRQIEALLWGRRGLAVTVMTVIFLLLFIVPFWLAIGTIVANSGQIEQWIAAVATMKVPPAPDWLSGIPIIGANAAKSWQKIEEMTGPEALQQVRPYAGTITQWFVGAIGGFGTLLLQFLLTIVAAAIMYAQGERFAAAIIRFGNRLGGLRGQQAVVLAGQAIRGVALGVVVTAFIQTALGSMAVLIAGIPYGPILCAIMFMLCIAQLGPALVLIPAIFWMFANSETTPAIFFLIGSIVAIGADNVLRPLLIRKGVDLPLLLILVGVIGGLIGFGMIGLFLGPTVLAVGYTLLDAWIAEADEGAELLPAPQAVKSPGGQPG
jgi:predicted PurR-regulated permease PerM